MLPFADVPTTVALWCRAILLVGEAWLERRCARKAEYAHDWHQTHKERRAAAERKRRENPEVRARQREAALRSYWKHADRRRAESREYNAQHREEKRAYRQAYSAANRERLTAYAARWREKNKDRDLDNRLRRNYGITLTEFERMLLAQGGCCAICGRKRGGSRNQGVRLHVDHDHASGRARGLLCGTCNRGIGQLGDDPQRARAAARYLERTRQASPSAEPPPLFCDPSDNAAVLH